MYNSMMTFIYVQDLNETLEFIEQGLGLEAVFQPSWAKVYQVAQGGFLGVVDQSKGSNNHAYTGGSLISLTVDQVDDYYDRIRAFGVEGLTDIKVFEDIGVRSFFFKGPGGYDFEIQMFTKAEVRALFE